MSSLINLALPRLTLNLNLMCDSNDRCPQRRQGLDDLQTHLPTIFPYFPEQKLISILSILIRLNLNPCFLRSDTKHLFFPPCLCSPVISQSACILQSSNETECRGRRHRKCSFSANILALLNGLDRMFIICFYYKAVKSRSGNLSVHAGKQVHGFSVLRLICRS